MEEIHVGEEIEMPGAVDELITRYLQPGHVVHEPYVGMPVRVVRSAQSQRDACNIHVVSTIIRGTETLLISYNTKARLDQTVARWLLALCRRQDDILPEPIVGEARVEPEEYAY